MTKKRRGRTKKERRRRKKEQLKNKKLIKQYYWLMPRNVWSGKLLSDYDYTFINWGWSEGWDKAFGNLFMKELGEEIKRIGQTNFMILDIKEKYGQARCYTSGTSAKAHDIIYKYEALSENICYFCGKPDVPMTNMGWILPMCRDCYEKHWRRGSKFEYEEVISNESQMADKYTVRQFSQEGTKDIVYDYSDTTNEIRRWWSKKHKGTN